MAQHFSQSFLPTTARLWAQGEAVPVPKFRPQVPTPLCRGVVRNGHQQDLLGEIRSRNSCYTHQFLRAGGGANWNYQTSADLELHLQRFWNFWAACCNYNRVVGRMFGPAARAIAVQDVHVVIPLLGKRGGGLFSQLSDPLNRVNVLRYFSENSCRVTRACTDFENLSPPSSSNASIMNATM